MEQKKRDSNIELLRVIAMLIIIGHHYCVHGVLEVDSAYEYFNYVSLSNINKIVSMIISPGGEVGVAIFFMITGHFGIGRKKKIEKIISPVLFYAILSITVFVITSIVGYGHAIDNNFISYLFRLVMTPVTGSVWWYVTAYVILLISSKYIDDLFYNVSLKKYSLMLFVAWFVYFCAIVGGPFFQLYKAIFFYLLGGFLNYKKKQCKRTIFLTSFILLWLLGAVNFNAIVNSRIIGLPIKAQIYIFVFSGVLVPLISTMLFIFIDSIQFENKLINSLGKYVFGVYLFHDSGIMQPLIWNTLLKVSSVQINNRYMPILMIVSIILVFILGMLVEWLRINTWEQLYNCFKKIIVKKINSV